MPFEQMWCWFTCALNVNLLGLCAACVCTGSPNPSAFPASLKAVRIAFSQRLTAVVLRSLTNELLYCLFPSLCTDGRILSTSFYCYWMESARCMHSAAIIIFFSGFYRYIFFFVMCPNDFNFFQCLRKGKVFEWSHICAAIAQVLGVNPPILFSGSSNMVFVSISRPNWNGSDQLNHTVLGENWYSCLI